MCFGKRRNERHLLTPATLVAVRGRPTLASAVSRENLVGDQLNEAGTAAQTKAVLAERANTLSFFMIIVSRLVPTKLTKRRPAGSLDLYPLVRPTLQLYLTAKNMDRWNLRCSASVQHGIGKLSTEGIVR